MTEDALYAVSGIVGVLVGLLCYRRIYRDGKSRRQRRAERWAARGGVAEGVSTSVERLCAGDLDARAPEERRYRSRYHYRVGGRTYTAFLRALDEYPARVTVYYNPERPDLRPAHAAVDRGEWRCARQAVHALISSKDESRASESTNGEDGHIRIPCLEADLARRPSTATSWSSAVFRYLQVRFGRFADMAARRVRAGREPPPQVAGPGPARLRPGCGNLVMRSEINQLPWPAKTLYVVDASKIEYMI